MSRGRRIEFPGGLYHVMNRGVMKTNIVITDEDRHHWFRLFDRVATRCGWRVFAHVLMTNHFHVFLKLTSGNLSTGMHDLQSGYATVFNNNHHRDGVLFEGRFKALLVEDAGHAWSLSRYLHLNPCRSNLVKRPEAYEWSTYRHFLDPRLAPACLDWRTVLSEFAGTEAAARIAYRRYVLQGLEQPIENPFAQVYADTLLGGPEFIDAHRHLLDEAEADVDRISRSASLDAVLSAVATDFATTASEVTRRGRHGNIAREVALWLARDTVRSPLKELAITFGISSATASLTVRQCEDRQSKSTDLRDRCARLRQQVLSLPVTK